MIRLFFRQLISDSGVAPGRFLRRRGIIGRINRTRAVNKQRAEIGREKKIEQLPLVVFPKPASIFHPGKGDSLDDPSAESKKNG
jgi:hypothetical protein